MKDKLTSIFGSCIVLGLGFFIRWIGKSLYESGVTRHYVGFPMYGYMYDHDSIQCAIGVLIQWGSWLIIIFGAIAVLVSIFSKS